MFNPFSVVFYSQKLSLVSIYPLVTYEAPLPPYVFMAWHFVKHRDKFTLSYKEFSPVDKSIYFQINIIVNVHRKDMFLSLRTKKGEASIAQWYRAEPRAGWPGVRVPAGDGSFSLHPRVQTGSEAHPPSYSMGTRGSFPGGKAAGA
jgi:hypothetical protein